MMSAQAIVDALEAGIPELMQEAKVPGLAVTLIQHDDIVWSQVYGVRDRDTKAPVTLGTLFEAASLTKPLFAYAALKLCEQGVLDLDIPLVEYLPDDHLSIPLPSSGPLPERLVLEKPQLGRITLRQVLSHTTGFPNWPSKEQPLKSYFTPGERFSYSGASYSVLQSIVEILTGQPAATYVQASILDPFGMTNSRLVWTGQEHVPVAVGHDENGNLVEKMAWPEMIAGASLHSTSQDYARFMLAVMQPAVDKPEHLHTTLAKDMLTAQVKVNDSASWRDDWPKSEIMLDEFVSWGLGWGLQHTASEDSFWHWGDNGNYQNFAIGSGDKDYGIVIMTNGRQGKRVYQRILTEMIGGEYPSLDWLMNL